MPSKIDEGYCIFGAEGISKNLVALRAEIDGVRRAEDIEFIHRMRVASRRLRSALPLFEDCFPAKRFAIWMKNIKKITRSLGSARDMDVQLEELNKFLEKHAEPAYKPGLRRLELRLQQQRNRSQEKVLQALDPLESPSVLPDLENNLTHTLTKANLTYPYTPYVYQKAYEAIAARLEQLLSYEPFISHPEATTELHAMRIAAKQLRYTLEIFSSIYSGELKQFLQTVKKIQDNLGELHDCDVWITFLPEFLQKEYDFTLEFYGNTRTFRRLIPGIQAFQADREKARQEHYQEFWENWEKSRKQSIWDKLQAASRIPYFQGDFQTPNQSESDAENNPKETVG